MQKEDLIDLYNDRGKKLRKNRKIFYAKYRQDLLENAKAKTLEVAVGAGANFPFYPPEIELTAVDFSPVLLKIAAESAKDNHLNVRFIQSDVESLSFAENSFDTIVSTLTLCAYDDPVKVLRSFSKWCKPEGNILLFEHGLGSNISINWILNKMDNWSYRKNGDHLNLDVRKTLTQSGLSIDEMKTAILGTHYIIKAKPNKNL